MENKVTFDKEDVAETYIHWRLIYLDQFGLLLIIGRQFCDRAWEQFMHQPSCMQHRRRAA